jgi:hypothetical protein
MIKKMKITKEQNYGYTMYIFHPISVYKDNKIEKYG